MHRAAGDLHAVLERLLLRVKTRKSGQQGRVNVQDTLVERTHEGGAQQAHEARQAYQIDLAPVELIDQQSVIDFAIQAFRGDRDGIEPPVARDGKPAGFRPVADHHRYLRVEASGSRLIGYGFEVGSAAGEQNAQPLHRYSTRGPPRLAVMTRPTV